MRAIKSSRKKIKPSERKAQFRLRQYCYRSLFKVWQFGLDGEFPDFILRCRAVAVRVAVGAVEQAVHSNVDLFEEGVKLKFKGAFFLSNLGAFLFFFPPQGPY